MEVKKYENRINSIDALRGFALAGILFSHMLEQFMASAPSKEIKEVMFSTDLDFFIERTIHWLVQGKFFALFAILFGVSYSIQLDSGLKKMSNTSFTFLYLWRILILFCIGLAHHLMYSGDILSVFAPIAFFLLFFNRVSPKWVLIFSMLLLFGAGRYVRFWLFGQEHFIPNFSIPDLSKSYIHALQNGTAFDVAYHNVFLFVSKWKYQLGIPGRAFLTLGYFLFGMWLGRKSFFQKINTNLLFKIIALCSILCTSYFFIPDGFLSSPDVELNEWLIVSMVTLKDLFNTSLTFLIASLFLLTYLKRGAFIAFFESYGRMALSNYIMQSFICVFILYNWGLGYMGELSNSQTLLLTFVVIVFQVMYSNWWMKHFYYGPLEWVWRSLTYFKLQRFKK